MTKDRISVIIPVYNAQERLALSIESVLKQTYKEFELILVDDGSRDDSAKICDDYEKLDPRVVVIHQENKRVSAARNRGLAAARGDYITFVDADDTIEPEAFEKSMEIFKEQAVDLVILGMYFDYYQEGKLQKSQQRSIDRQICFDVKAIQPYFFDLANQNYLVSIWNKVIRAEIIKENKLFFEVDMSILEDFKFVLDVLEKSQSLCASPQAYYHYYHDCSLSQIKRRPGIDYFRNFQILDHRLRRFSQAFSLDDETGGARIDGMIFRYYLTAVEKLYSGSGSFLEKYRDMKKFMQRGDVCTAGKNAQVSGFRLRLLLGLFNKKSFRTLAVLFFINDWRAQIKKS